METQQTQTFWQRNSIMIKSMIVGFLIIVLLIPAALIQDLVHERQERQFLACFDLELPPLHYLCVFDVC